MMDIKSIGLDMALRKLDEVTAQRDELLAALKAAEDLRRKGLINSEPGEMERVDAMRREAIAKCEVQS